MSVIRPFEATDILRYNQVNADVWTASYHPGYYASYLAQWPDFCLTTTGAYDDEIKAYMIGKHEPPPPDTQHHGHLTALSICPAFRSLGLAKVYMDILEELCHPIPAPQPGDTPADTSKRRDARDRVDAWFVDLFVRCNNKRAIELYEKLGYSVFRRVVDYYSGMEGPDSPRDLLDGFDMRKSMPRDTEGKYVRANGRDILVQPQDVWS